jgi:hypothetical protein
VSSLVDHEPSDRACNLRSVCHALLIIYFPSGWVPTAAALASFFWHRDKMQVRMSHATLSGEFVRMAP